MPKIIVDHPSFVGAETTYLTDDVPAAAVALAVKNTNIFAQNDYIYVGKVGNEGTELRKISSVTGQTGIGIDALVMPHASGTQIMKADYNQIKIYRSATQSGTFTAIATVDLDVDAPDGTVYNDTAGSTSNWYKIAYYNSTTAAESGLSGAVQGSGFEDNTAKMMIDDVAEMIGDKDHKYISRDSILNKLNRWQNVWWLSPYTKRDLKKEDTLKTNANDNYILLSELSETFDKLVDDYSVRYRYVVGSTTDEVYCLHILSVAEFYEKHGDNLEADSDELENCAIDIANGKLLLGPTPVTADKSITVYYYFRPSRLVEETDTTICPVPSIITLGCASEILILKGERDKAAELMKIRNDLIMGDMEHTRVKAGSTRIHFKSNFDRGRFK